MMKKLLKAMMDSTSEVMETMFYFPVEFDDEPEPLDIDAMSEKEPCLASFIGFSGDFSGSFTLIMPEKLLMVMAENFMGEPGHMITREHLMGTLTETLNMICGSTLARFANKEPFNLELPRIINIPSGSVNDVFFLVRTPDSWMAINAAYEN